MSRSGYGYCDSGSLNLWRGTVKRSINGKRGQDFLKELAKAMDEMPEKRLIKNELISENGEVCAIGVVCKSRGLKVGHVELEDPAEVGSLVGISMALAAEIEYLNDEFDYYRVVKETPEERWIRMRKWVDGQIKKPKPAQEE